MNPYFVKKHLPFRAQDSENTVLLLFFLLFPISALLPHAHALAALLCLLLFLFGTRKKEGKEGLKCKESVCFSLFLALTLSGVLLPLARWETLLSFLLRLSFFLPFLFAEKVQKMRRYLSYIGGVLGGLALLELLFGFGKEGYTDTSLFASLSRAGGIFGNPNILAAFLLPAALFSLSALLFEDGGIALLLAFLGSASGIASSYSRGALLALFFCAFLLFWRRFGLPRVLLFLFAFLPLALLLLPDSIRARLCSLLSPDTSVSYRVSLWRSIFRLPPRTLLFGVGEGKEAMLSSLSPVLAAGLLHIEHTHSLFLHFLLSNGLLGLAFFLFFCGWALLGGKARGARVATLSLLLFGIFDDPLYCGQTEVLFWLTLGLSFGA